MAASSAKIKEEETRGTGTSPPEPSELDILIEEIVEREKLEMEAGVKQAKNAEQERKQKKSGRKQWRKLAKQRKETTLIAWKV